MTKVSELVGATLDYWTGKATGYECHFEFGWVVAMSDGRLISSNYTPSIDWTQGGPLIEKYHLDVCEWKNKGYYCVDNNGYCSDGPNALVAICRAVVRSVFGDEVPNV